jgi:hypothetical protein
VADPEKFFYGTSLDATAGDSPATEQNSTAVGGEAITGNLITAITNNPMISKVGIVLGFIVIAGMLVYYFFFIGKEPYPSVSHEKAKETAFNHALSGIDSDNLDFPHDDGFKDVPIRQVRPAKSEPAQPESKSDASEDDYRNMKKMTVNRNSSYQVSRYPDDDFDLGFYYRKNMSTDYEKLGLRTLKQMDYYSLLKESHLRADDLDFDRANRAYYLLFNELGKLPEQENILMHSKLGFLKAKLDLIIRINQAHSCVNIKDYTTLVPILNDIADLYNYVIKEFPEKTRLTDDVRHWHAKYASQLKSFAMNIME